MNGLHLPAGNRRHSWKVDHYLETNLTYYYDVTKHGWEQTHGGRAGALSLGPPVRWARSNYLSIFSRVKFRYSIVRSHSFDDSRWRLPLYRVRRIPHHDGEFRIRRQQIGPCYCSSPIVEFRSVSVIMKDFIRIESSSYSSLFNNLICRLF